MTHQFLLVLTLLVTASPLRAQTNIPIRLALISETGDTSPVADLLTAELSRKGNLQLLERNEIERVYREQGLSAANRNYLKLGQVLGADGLLVLELSRRGQLTNLISRLIAVKPGVILTEESLPWPIKETRSWAEYFATRLRTLSPKLLVPRTDAVPISVVNLRSAVQSAESVETERQLTLLTIERLSREPRVFVLERRRMQLMSEEKELNADESAFWSGRYLLEGVIDRDGYSRDRISISARLTLPKGTAPLSLEVQGSRANLSEVVNALAVKVNAALNIASTAGAWSAADEAAQYLNEANWALKWDLLREAQAAADAAWALGKQDLDCALVRVRAYLAEIPRTVPANTDLFKNGRKDPHYVHISDPPQPADIDRALRALALYDHFSRVSTDGTPRVLHGGPGWRNSEWYQLGIDNLTAVAQVLLHYHAHPEAQPPLVSQKLATLRALARSVAGMISRSPSVHDSYFLGDRIPGPNELDRTMTENPSIFGCELEWGCTWQETPEDCIALYRRLLSSPVFCYIHRGFWYSADWDFPLQRLTAWNEPDRRRIPSVWSSFRRELSASTNLWWRLEGKSLDLLGSKNDAEADANFSALFDSLLTNRGIIISNPVGILNGDWDGYDLVSAIGPGPTSSKKESLQRRFFAEYRPRLNAMDEDHRRFWEQSFAAAQFLPEFAKQKEYLKQTNGHNGQEFMAVFRTRTYSSEQAQELQPLVAAYETNLVTEAAGVTGQKRGQLLAEVARIGFLKKDLDRALHPPAKQAPAPPRPLNAVAPVQPMQRAVSNSVPAREPPIIRVTRFLELPLRGLEGDDISQVKITAHQWMEGKLLLDFQYTATFHSFNNKGAWNGTRQATLPAIALLDPVKGEWNVISCPEPALAAQNNLYYRSTLLRGALFTSDGQKIQQYDFQSRRWKVLGLSTEDNFQLFAIRGRLYAANGTTILEIVDGGKSSRVLASTRRNPPASTLDRLPELGIPILFEGADHSLLVWVQNKIYAWAQDDWQEKIEASSVVQPQLFDAGLLFRTGASSGQLPRIFRFLGGATSPTLCLIERVPPEHPEFRNLYRPTAGSLSPQKPLWRCPEKMALGNLPVALRREDLFLLADRSGVRQIVNDRHLIVKEEIVPHNGCNAELFCFSHELRTPQIVRLKFEAPNGCPPVPGVDLGARWVFGRSPPGWMVFAGDLVCFGLESSGIESSEWHRVGCPPGIWTMAASELEAVSAVERKIQLAEISRERLAIEHRQQAVIAKYDRNHNGRVDLEERSDALIDPAFLEMEVHKIDANGNGTLDLDELAWFDANSNRILDADEEKATDRAQDFLAQKTFAALDLDENGVLGASEWSNFQARRGAPVTTGNFPAQAFADRRPSMDLAAFATYCRQATRMQLTRGNRVSGPVDPWTQRRGPPPSIKETVENYWTRTNGNVAGPEMKSPR